ncbi:MAG: hypothetical protein KH230_08515 [Enterocloster asparagiformis]|nr:hypothetical protein [Enterocloster asparagiformis]
MKKTLSVLATAGMIAIFSVSAFAAEPRTAAGSPAPTAKGEVYVTDLGEGMSIDDVARDIF